MFNQARSQTVDLNSLPRVSRLVSRCVEALSEESNTEALFTTLVHVIRSLESIAKISERLWCSESSFKASGVNGT
jgi:hypothetical protein